MRPLCWTALIALFALAPVHHDADVALAADGASRAKYDRFRDQTEYSTDYLRLYSDSLGMEWTRLTLMASFSCPGKKRCSPDSIRVSLFFSAVRPRFGHHDDRQLIFLAGDLRVPTAIQRYRAEMLAGMSSESFTTTVPADVAVRLFREHGEGRLGKIEFFIRTPRTAAALDEFVRLLEPER